MKVLKIIGKVFLVLLVIAVLAVGAWYGYQYLLLHTSQVAFDRGRVSEFGAWKRKEQGEPDMYIPVSDGECYFIMDKYVYYDVDIDDESQETLELFDDGNRSLNYTVGVVDGFPVSVTDEAGEQVDDFDLSGYLHDGRVCYEVYGVDPDVCIDDLSTVSFKYAGYGGLDENRSALMTHYWVHMRGIDTGKCDYHLSAQKYHHGSVGNYEEKMEWCYGAPLDNDEIVPVPQYSHEDYLCNSPFRYVKFIRHWDGESDIVAYAPYRETRTHIYDIELNPELDDYLFEPESLLRYRNHEFYKGLQN
ncbi:MAG: hypothetical protein GX369_08310 [Euryarchaeota archaeon]|nr:hypothetical protein [Euryarchaeota archaeon]